MLLRIYLALKYNEYKHSLIIIIQLHTGLLVLNGGHGATGDPMLTFVGNGLVIDRPE